MISSSELAKTIVSDLDQNAYTTWHDEQKILRAINSACDFVLAFGRWPWSLKLTKISNTTKTDTFTFPHAIFYPYWWQLDDSIIESTNVPIVWLESEKSWTFYAVENIVRTKDQWLNLSLLYHRWHQKLQSIWNNDIDMPEAMFQVLVHVSLWFVYPWWLDVWSSLANQNFQMADKLLTTYGKAYWFNLQAKQAEAAGIYTRT